MFFSCSMIAALVFDDRRFPLNRRAGRLFVHDVVRVELFHALHELAFLDHFEDLLGLLEQRGGAHRGHG
jgi:hypothetical protein